MYKVPEQSILFIGVKAQVCELYTDQCVYRFNSSLAKYLKSLPPGLLVQVNHAQAVNLNRASNISRKEIVVAGRSFYLGPSYARALFKQFKTLG